jgi:hypothetical protein
VLFLFNAPFFIHSEFSARQAAAVNFQGEKLYQQKQL